MVNEAAKAKFLKRNPDKGPSLATRQKMNRAEQKRMESFYPVSFRPPDESWLARWTPDPKAVARKKKMLQDKSMAFLRSLRSRAGRRTLGKG